MIEAIADIVDQVIAHAQTMLDENAYDWPTSRAALTRILADLEARTFGHPSLERLRRYIAESDEAWNADQSETR